MERQSPDSSKQVHTPLSRVRAETEQKHNAYNPPPGLWPPIDYSAGTNGECLKHLPG